MERRKARAVAVWMACFAVFAAVDVLAWKGLQGDEAPKEPPAAASPSAFDPPVPEPSDSLSISEPLEPAGDVWLDDTAEPRGKEEWYGADPALAVGSKYRVDMGAGGVADPATEAVARALMDAGFHGDAIFVYHDYGFSEVSMNTGTADVNLRMDVRHSYGEPYYSYYAEAAPAYLSPASERYVSRTKYMEQWDFLGRAYPDGRFQEGSKDGKAFVFTRPVELGGGRGYVEAKYVAYVGAFYIEATGYYDPSERWSPEDADGIMANVDRFVDMVLDAIRPAMDDANASGELPAGFVRENREYPESFSGEGVARDPDLQDMAQRIANDIAYVGSGVSVDAMYYEDYGCVSMDAHWESAYASIAFVKEYGRTDTDLREWYERTYDETCSAKRGGYAIYETIAGSRDGPYAVFVNEDHDMADYIAYVDGLSIRGSARCGSDGGFEDALRMLQFMVEEALLGALPRFRY